MPASVVIVGGGVIGAATACFLARDFAAEVIVLERDPTYARASSALSAASIRQQFSTPVNIALSRWSLDFLRRVGDELAAGDERPQIGLTLPGYLYLARAPEAAALRESHAVQRRHGVGVELLAAHELRARFPWLRSDDLALGALGAGFEGWFDGPALMQAFRRKAIACGARFVHAEAAAFETRDDRVVAALTAEGRRIGCDALLVAAGAWSTPLAARFGIDIPVSAKKRDVFVLRSPAALPGCPLVIDPCGVWFRPEGAGFIAGAPPRDDEADAAPLERIDHALFDDVIWPALAHRVPGFEALRVASAWAGYYEMNGFDRNGLTGALPGWRNAYLACGFSGHGMQHAPAVGCAMARLIATGNSGDIDLSPLDVRRIAERRPLVERNVI